MDERLFMSQHSPRNESSPSMNNLVSPPRNGSRLPQPNAPTHELRSSLPRRFTTDSGRVPTLSSIISQRGPLPGPDPNVCSTSADAVQLEKKKQEYERLREQRRRFELEMQKLEQAQRREELELAKMQDDLTRQGHQSEPTTPPEYHDSSGFPSMFSRPNRYSMSSLISPPGLFNRPARSGSLLTSPPSNILSSRMPFEDHLPSRSVPITRRNSDDEEKEEAVRQDPSSHRSSNAGTSYSKNNQNADSGRNSYNRYSMPVTRSRNGLYGADLDQTGTARFLFGEEDSGDARYGQVFRDESFPTLVRREDQMLSASSAALDLALSPSPSPEVSSSTKGWGNINRHRARQSLSTINTSQLNGPTSAAEGTRSSTIRHSLDLQYFSENSSDPPSVVSPPGNPIMASAPSLQSSFSGNDVQTVRNGSGANNHAQQHFHNHNASMGRIPAGAVPTRHTRELSNDSTAAARDQAGAYHSLQGALQGGAAPFGPAGNGIATTHTSPGGGSTTTASGSGGANSSYGFYPGGPNYSSPTSSAPPVTGTGTFGVPFIATGMQGLNLNGGTMYPPQNYTGYGGNHYPTHSPRDSQHRVIQNRRQIDSEAMLRYQNLPLEHVGGQIYELCKDQHGCRYLQKKLEERNPDHVHMIWLETNQHVIELMTDPFGNYLCQKLLEYCNDEERTVLVQNASHDMVRIALNQHGTRALQKMIEFVTLPVQVQTIIEALRNRVVELIQDLNGNHVIQKCLNKLSAIDAQFIFDAVGNNCVDVGTHRHGCCVLQRCIDHADGQQKVWLIGKITEHAPILVQDPYGNYVVQYIIDLNESAFTEPVVAMFRNRISQLSRHKFSSNVIEKCLRCSQDVSRDMIVDELLNPGELDRVLRDSFANYVVQTALDCATPAGKARLVEGIRPFLPSIRSTPYGRRIQAKIQAYDNRGTAAMAGQSTPADNTQGQVPLRPGHNRGMVNNTSIVTPGGPLPNGGGMAQQPSYPLASNLTVPPPVLPPPQQQQEASQMQGQAFGQDQNRDQAKTQPESQPSQFQPEPGQSQQQQQMQLPTNGASRSPPGAGNGDGPRWL
ncbi:ARM repeat-containing protein [Sodiomyces alkalinus F11]|uniref:ARM repeat-containing protein n=1 Tax=Sodiomyces alkalinus (strain CBS 110278 / VKM F-3762 / F11) TaxID=1314773 RepID=A0A3N2Q6W7_SODAK|nr:ARM repeat-containing protein [Sodiomyces alkalinus F11]ROT42456.1 ARM repeat-containing protein [Sodiomyces alkalinus F11]